MKLQTKNLLHCTFAMLLLSNCQQKNKSGDFTVRCDIKNVANQQVYLMYWYQYDEILIVGSKIDFDLLVLPSDLLVEAIQEILRI